MNRLALALLLASAVPAAASAQGVGADSAHLRNECRLAAQVVTTGNPAPKATWARGFLFSCAHLEVATVMTLWDRAADTDADVDYLISLSARVLDDRLARHLTGIATDRRRPARHRVGAIAVLGEYVRPSLSYNLTSLALPPSEADRMYVPLATSVHRVRRRGVVPLTSGTLEAIPSVLRQVRATPAEDAWPAFAAWAVLRALREPVAADPS